jgi:MFS transporter, PAT family, beta-lactamase induction signal transducer AmpG
MTDQDATRSHPHPSIYLLLNLPFGAVSGYLTVALAYFLARHDMPVEQIGALIAIYLLPQAWKFLWAPIVDTTLTRKRWYVVGAIMTGLGVLAMSIFSTQATTFAVLAALAVMSSVAVSFLGMAVESLAANGTSAAEKGRAGGWLQAGSLGGVGLGGGAALWLMQHVSLPWITGAALSACIMLCCLPLLLVAEPPQAAIQRHSALHKLMDVLRDIWHVLRVPGGYMALLVVFLPIGTGAASNFWSAVADEWQASATLVALINGAAGGIASAVGCLAGGYLSDRFNRKFAYVGFGLFQMVCAVSMALWPHTPAAYVVFTLIYAFGSGLTFSGFSAVTLEAIGHGAAATKYNVFASLSNMPITYMTAIEGWAHPRWGTKGLLFLEAGLAIVSAVIFTAANALSARRAAPLVAEPV